MEITICSGPLGISPNEFFDSSLLVPLLAATGRADFLRADGFNATGGLFDQPFVWSGCASAKPATNRYATPATRVLRKSAIPTPPAPVPPAECGTGAKQINVVTLVSPTHNDLFGPGTAFCGWHGSRWRGNGAF